MEQRAIKALLEQVAAGQVDVNDALLKLKMEPFEELGFAKLDSHRGLRQGVAEVIYGNRRICDGSTLDDVLGPSAHITWMVDCAPAPDGMVACGGFECRIGSGVKCEVQAYLEIGD